MINWRRGGWTGSLRRFAKREVAEHLRGNFAARVNRYSIAHRILRQFLSMRTFGQFFLVYVTANVIVAAAEAITARFSPDLLPSWTAIGGTPTTDIKAQIFNVSSYLLGAQIGLLGIMSLALALVTLIAQREESPTDIKIYYHESLSFEVVASCLALAAVLCAQLLWPLQFAMHRLGYGTTFQIFKLALLCLHLGWLLMNIVAIAYFIATTFRFVQPSSREKLRERYTVNVVMPHNLAHRISETLYAVAGKEILPSEGNQLFHTNPTATFGYDFGAPWEEEVVSTFPSKATLYDVRISWVRWVLLRWSRRSIIDAVMHANGPRTRSDQPTIWFTPILGQNLNGTVTWCRRRGGCPLTSIEKFILKRAFCFRGVRSET